MSNPEEEYAEEEAGAGCLVMLVTTIAFILFAALGIVTYTVVSVILPDLIDLLNQSSY